MPKNQHGFIQLILIAAVVLLIGGLTIYSNLNSAKDLINQNPNVLGVVYEQDPTQLSMQDQFKQKVNETLDFIHSLIFTK